MPFGVDSTRRQRDKEVMPFQGLLLFRAGGPDFGQIIDVTKMLVYGAGRL
jgi:hypothetical protein